jgi:hypothetical protein
MEIPRDDSVVEWTSILQLRSTGPTLSVPG